MPRRNLIWKKNHFTALLDLLLTGLCDCIRDYFLSAVILDLPHLERVTFEDRSLQREVLTLFCTQLGAHLVRLGVGVDDDELLELLHTIKGAARGVGAVALAECVADEESRCRAGQSCRMERVSSVAVQTQQAIEHRLAALS